ncbi:hypothetical protein K402DRAFT_406247 [Aulographum hederae CBS 113979]|uniref:Uncharacterized protein n=1 Tax=Aulographum hederae CBS 113979 TaxID=1176131 RepID=A0A6G1GTJ4_9PEZI|nr:hypothetical protein K402DRAFT_406247 [Aulographum hederae CBS 113979]
MSRRSAIHYCDSNPHSTRLQTPADNIFLWPTLTDGSESWMQNDEGQCDVLLANNRKYSQRQANFLENAKWHIAGDQAKANALRARLQFHESKMELFLRPIELQLHLTTHAAIRATRDEVAHIPTRVRDMLSPNPVSRQLPPVPPQLDTKYVEGLQFNKPRAFTSGDFFPLAEGIDALVFHLNQSTIQFAGTGLGIFRPSPKQCNSLIKSRWLFEKLVHNSVLSEAGPDSLYAVTLESLFEKIKVQYERFGHELDHVLDDIESLPAEAFHVWLPDEPVAMPPSIKDPKREHSEIKILERPMGERGAYKNRVLTVFRRPDLKVLRLVRTATLDSTTTLEGLPPAVHEEEREIDLHKVSLVPHYARGPEPKIEIRFPGLASGDDYLFDNKLHLYDFQQSLTGYRVEYAARAEWKLHYSSKVPFSSKDNAGAGEVQLWYPELLSDITPSQDQGPPQGIQRAMSIYSNFEVAGSGIPSPTFPTNNPASDDNSTTLYQSRPPAPVLIILTKWDKQLCYLHLRLRKSMDIHKPRCDCKSDKESQTSDCRRVVIECEPPSRTPFPVRKHVVESTGAESQLDEWNMALFALPQAPHPASDLIKEKETKWLSLNFNTVADRKAFQESFGLVSMKRNESDAAFELKSRQIRTRSLRPNANQAAPRSQSGNTRMIRAHSSSSHGSVSSLGSPTSPHPRERLPHIHEMPASPPNGQSTDTFATPTHERGGFPTGLRIRGVSESGSSNISRPSSFDPADPSPRSSFAGPVSDNRTSQSTNEAPYPSSNHEYSIDAISPQSSYTTMSLATLWPSNANGSSSRQHQQYNYHTPHNNGPPAQHSISRRPVNQPAMHELADTSRTSGARSGGSVPELADTSGAFVRPAPQERRANQGNGYQQQMRYA